MLLTGCHGQTLVSAGAEEQQHLTGPWSFCSTQNQQQQQRRCLPKLKNSSAANVAAAAVEPAAPHQQLPGPSSFYWSSQGVSDRRGVGPRLQTSGPQTWRRYQDSKGETVLGAAMKHRLECLKGF